MAFVVYSIFRKRDLSRDPFFVFKQLGIKKLETIDLIASNFLIPNFKNPKLLNSKSSTLLSLEPPKAVC